MKTRGFARDEDGRLIPPGMTEVAYQQNFLLGETLPTWLTAPTGTAAASSWSSTAPGGMSIATSGTVDGDATLLGPAIHQNQFAAVAFEVRGLRFTGMFTSLLQFGLQSQTTPYGGAGIVQRHTEDWASFYIPGQGSTEFGRMGYTLRTLGESVKYRNIGFIYNCRTRTAMFYEDDPAYPIGTLDVGTSLVQSGPIYPTLRLQAKAATVQSMRFAQVRLRLWPEPHAG